MRFLPAPFSHRRFLLTLLALGIGALAAVPLRAIPTVPAAATKSPAPIRDSSPRIEYEDLAGIARDYAFKAIWLEPEKRLQLHNRAFTLEFDAGSACMRVNGVIVYLGQNTVFRHGALLISKIDSARLLRPMLSSGRDAQPPPLRTVVIDAGHGGVFPGTQAGAPPLLEKEATLSVALHLRDALARAGLRVVMTRTADRELDPDWRTDLAKRTALANTAGADLFISLHFNAAPPAISGTETYILAPQHQLSMREDGPSDRDSLYSGNQYDGWNARLGYDVQRRLTSELKQNDRGLKYARWLVLRDLHCPGLLIESAFITNPGDFKKIGSPLFQEQLAQSIAAAIFDYAGRPANLQSLAAK